MIVLLEIRFIHRMINKKNNLTWKISGSRAIHKIAITINKHRAYYIILTHLILKKSSLLKNSLYRSTNEWHQHHLMCDHFHWMMLMILVPLASSYSLVNLHKEFFIKELFFRIRWLIILSLLIIWFFDFGIFLVLYQSDSGW